MPDRSMLEAAARAAGLNWRDWTPTVYHGETELRPWPYDWNPLEDDGDALRLAVKLGIEYQMRAGATWVQLPEKGYSVGLHHEPHGDDPHAATRRAIVRAAAAIGSAE